MEVGDLSMIRENKDLIGQRDDFARDQPQERFAVHDQFVTAGERLQEKHEDCEDAPSRQIEVRSEESELQTHFKTHQPLGQVKPRAIPRCKQKALWLNICCVKSRDKFEPDTNIF